MLNNSVGVDTPCLVPLIFGGALVSIPLRIMCLVSCLSISNSANQR